MSLRDPILLIALFLGFVLTFAEVYYITRRKNASKQMFFYAKSIFYINLLTLLFVVLISLAALAVGNAYFTLLFFLYVIPMSFIAMNSLERVAKNSGSILINYLFMLGSLFIIYFFFIISFISMSADIPKNDLNSYYLGVPLFFVYQTFLMLFGILLAKFFVNSSISDAET